MGRLNHPFSVLTCEELRQKEKHDLSSFFGRLLPLASRLLPDILSPFSRNICPSLLTRGCPQPESDRGGHCGAGESRRDSTCSGGFSLRHGSTLASRSCPLQVSGQQKKSCNLNKYSGSLQTHGKVLRNPYSQTLRLRISPKHWVRYLMRCPVFNSGQFLNDISGNFLSLSLPGA